MRDELLKSKVDYSEGQKKAAFNVMGEVVSLLGEYADDIVLIGGWVPSLLFSDKNHIGSIDVDILLNQNKIENTDKYETIARILVKNGYIRNTDHFFTFTKVVTYDGVEYIVDVDFLCGMYGGKDGKVSKHIDGVKALKISGGNFAFEVPSVEAKINYERTDGALDVCHVNVISIVPYLVLKSKALVGRVKPKDAYDIYFCITNYYGGIDKLIDDFMPYKDHDLVKEMCQILSEKFMSTEHVGPVDVANFLELDDPEEYEMKKQDAFQKINHIINQLS